MLTNKAKLTSIKIRKPSDQLPPPPLFTIWRQVAKSRSWSENKTQTASCWSLVTHCIPLSLGHGGFRWWHWWHSTLYIIWCLPPGVTWGWSLVTGLMPTVLRPLFWPDPGSQHRIDIAASRPLLQKITKMYSKHKLYWRGPILCTNTVICHFQNHFAGIGEHWEISTLRDYIFLWAPISSSAWPRQWLRVSLGWSQLSNIKWKN